MGTIIQAVLDRVNEKYIGDEFGNLAWISGQLATSGLTTDAVDSVVIRAVLTEQIRHTYQGFCPEELNGEMRDPLCIACECVDRLLTLICNPCSATAQGIAPRLRRKGKALS